MPNVAVCSRLVCCNGSWHPLKPLVQKLAGNCLSIPTILLHWLNGHWGHAWGWRATDSQAATLKTLWLSVRLQYLQYISNGDTAALHLTIHGYTNHTLSHWSVSVWEYYHQNGSFDNIFTLVVGSDYRIVILTTFLMWRLWRYFFFLHDGNPNSDNISFVFTRPLSFLVLKLEYSHRSWSVIWLLGFSFVGSSAPLLLSMKIKWVILSCQPILSIE